MQQIILDGLEMTSQEAAHAYIKEALSFPDYYGHNLDALFDLLSTIHESTAVSIINSDYITYSLGDYGTALLETFSDAAAENSALKVSTDKQKLAFAWTTLHVKDLDASLAFYCGILGFRLDSRFGGGGTEIAMLGEPDEPKLELIHLADDQAISPGSFSVGFSLEDPENILRRLSQFPEVEVTGPFSPNPSLQFYFISDPDGYRIQFVKYISPDK